MSLRSAFLSHYPKKIGKKEKEKKKNKTNKQQQQQKIASTRNRKGDLSLTSAALYHRTDA